MFSRNVHHLQLSYPFSTAESHRDHGGQYGMVKRQMGPPPLSHPQPVEIDPYNRLSGPCPPWDSAVNVASSAGELNTLFSTSMSLDKSAAVSPEYGLRNGSRDPFAEWYTGKTQPWVPKGAVPEVCLDDRPPARGYPYPWRDAGNGHQPGIQNRPGHPSDTGSVQFGVLSSDSGYGSAIGLESASARGSDIVDHSPEIRSLTARFPSFLPYGDGGSMRETHEPLQPWHLASTNTGQFYCAHCNQPARTKSELKKHELRHTKPFRCGEKGCSRTEGFSTSNDLERHMKSKHPAECSEELLLKTYHCLVDGCKSKDKKWPRLDNFRSHLKRIHRLSDSEIEHYVRRVETERKTRDAQLSQETPHDVQRRVDQEQSPCMESPDEPDLPFEAGDSHWSPLGSAVLGPHPDLIDPALQEDDTENAGMPRKHLHFQFGFDNKREKPNSLAEDKALDEANDLNGCLEGQKILQSNHMSIETMTSPATYLVGSPMGAAKAKIFKETGKECKTQNLLKLDPTLRDVITAVFSQGRIGDNTVLGQRSKNLPEAELSVMLHSPRSSVGKTDFVMPMSCLEASVSESLDGQAPCSEALHTLDTDKKDPIDAEQKLQEILRAFQNAGYTLKKDKKSVGSNQPRDQQGSSSTKKRDLVTCTRCSKFRGRPCELKKHMKRHNRPYGCTFPKCHKTFGSKNDWKRHENSQHYQHEKWRCDEETNGKLCGKVFYTADSARTHFTKLHMVEELEILERKIAACRIGPNNQRRFWCGFCEKIVDVSQKSEDSWTERYNHIDDHFMGRNNQPKQSIIHWKANEEDDEEAQKELSSHGENEKYSSESSSPTSPDKLSGSSNASTENSSEDASSATLDSRKRKGTHSNAQDPRPSKMARSAKAEPRIICCQCQQHYNPKTDTECTVDEHRFCVLCRTARVQLDPPVH